MKSRTQKVSINVLYGISNRIILMMLEFVARYFFVKHLGSELLGINGVFTNIIQCLSLAELGMNNVVMFSYYKPLAEDDDKRLSALNTFYHKIYSGIAACILIIGICLIPFLGLIINTSYEIPHLKIIYMFYLADTVISYFCIYKVTILSADQNGYIATRYEIVTNIVRTILQILSLMIFQDLLLYLAIKTISGVLCNALKARQASRLYKFTTVKSKLEKKDKEDIILTIRSGFIYKLSAVLLNSTDNILISSIVGTVWVGLLSNYITICTAVSSFVTITFNSMTASVGNLVTTEQKEKKLHIFNVMTIAANWTAMVCFICTFVLCDEFVTLWLGQEQVMKMSIVLPKVMMLYVSCVMQPIFSYREALGSYVKTKYVMLLSAGVNFILSVILGIICGTSGILIASLIAVFSTYFWYEPKVLFRDHFRVPVSSYYKMMIKNMALCALSTGVIYWISSLFVADGWGKWIFKAAIIFSVVNLECYILYRKKKEFKTILDKIKSRSGR